MDNVVTAWKENIVSELRFSKEKEESRELSRLLMSQLTREMDQHEGTTPQFMSSEDIVTSPVVN